MGNQPDPTRTRHRISLNREEVDSFNRVRLKLWAAKHAEGLGKREASQARVLANALHVYERHLNKRLNAAGIDPDDVPTPAADSIAGGLPADPMRPYDDDERLQAEPPTPPRRVRPTIHDPGDVDRFFSITHLIDEGRLPEGIDPDELDLQPL